MPEPDRALTLPAVPTTSPRSTIARHAARISRSRPMSGRGRRHGVVPADRVERGALGCRTPGGMGGPDQLRRIQPDAVVAAGEPRDALLHQRPAQVVDAPAQRLRGRLEAELDPARLHAAPGPAQREPEPRGVLEALLGRD